MNFKNKIDSICYRLANLKDEIRELEPDPEPAAGECDPNIGSEDCPVCNPKPIPSAREHWLIAGRYFENEHDAIMWQGRNQSDFNEGIIHVRECE
jgi:hypothetical protein